MRISEMVLVALWPTAALTATDNYSHKDGLVDLGYATHIPTKVETALISGQRIKVYKNIRFGNPTSGNARFRRPDTNLPHTPGVQDGNYGPWNATACISSFPEFLSFPGLGNLSKFGTEDCLFLDVYVPEGVRPGDNVPVLHAFHGSGYAFGSKEAFFGPMGLFDSRGNNTAAAAVGGKGASGIHKFIFVANNYRMGMPGWTSMPNLDMDANPGFLDCLAAAEWTQKYIARFGGDPGRVTVLGQSAGAGIINLMTTLRGGRGQLPFQQAVVSSPCVPPRGKPISRQQELFQAVLDATNCTGLPCLRSLPEQAILEANDILVSHSISNGGGGVFGPSLGFGPVPDGKWIPDMPEVLFREGRYHRRGLQAVVVGHMLNEAMGLSSDSDMPARFPTIVRMIMPNATNATISKIQTLYEEKGNLTQPAQLAWEWTKDAVFACNGHNLANAFRDKTRRYIMSIPPATHGLEVNYFFYTSQETTPVSNPELVPEFQRRLLKFIHGLDPEWPLYGDSSAMYNITAEDGFEEMTLPAYLEERCEVVTEALLDPANGV